MIEIVCASLNFEEDFSIATQSKQNKDVVLLKVQYIFFQFRFIPFQEIFHKVKLYSSPQPAPTVPVHVWHLMDSLNQRKPCIFTISDKSFQALIKCASVAPFEFLQAHFKILTF
jgi:hypothetical protein